MMKSSTTTKYPNGASYTGQWNGEGEKHGQGSLAFQDGSKYNGQFYQGLCSGFGVMICADGSM